MSPFEIALSGVAAGFVLAMVLASYRVLVGPSVADRAIALDTVAYAAVGLVATAAVLGDQAALLDVGLVLSLLVFLGTVALARFLERVRRPKR